MALKGTYKDGALTITGLKTGDTTGTLKYDADSKYINTNSKTGTVMATEKSGTFTFTDAWDDTFGSQVKTISNKKNVLLTADLTGATNLEKYTGGSKVDTIILGGTMSKLAEATGGAGNDIITVNTGTFGTAAKVDAGAGNDTITAASNMEIIAGAGNDSLNLGSDTAITFTKTVDLGAGNDIVNINNNATVNDLKTTNGKNVVNINGKATITGGNGGDIFNLTGGATASIVAGNGADVFEIGNATAIINGGKGNNAYVLKAGAENVTVNDYTDGKVIKKLGNDRIVFNGVTADMISATRDNDGNVTVSIISDTTTSSITLALGSNASITPINIYSTNLNGVDANGKQLTGADKKASQAAYKTAVFSQTAQLDGSSEFIITNNDGANIYAKDVTDVNAGDYDLRDPEKADEEKNRKYKRTSAVNLTVEDNGIEVVTVTGSTKNDTINFKHIENGEGFLVDGGAGNDVFVIDSTDVNLTVASYDLNKDVIKFTENSGINRDDLKVENLNGENGISFKLTAGENFAITFTTAVSLSNGTTKNTNLLLQFGTEKKPSAYYATDPATAAITALKSKKPEDAIFNFAAQADTDTLVLGTNAIAGREVEYSSDVTTVDFSAVNAKLKITAGKPSIIASKGNDTIIGSGKGTDEVPQSPVDGSAGNDLFIDGEGRNIFVGGAGNDTFKSGGSYTDVGKNTTDFTGGAGNDVISLGLSGVVQVNDYNNVIGTTDADKKRKKDLGTDKIVFNYDGYTKNQIAQVNTLINNSGEFDGKNLNLGYTTKSWESETGIYSSALSTGAVIFRNLHLGDQWDVTYQGINYKQVIESGTAVTATGNYLGYLNPNATSITLDSRKAAKLVGNNNTTTIVGAAKNDTLIFNSDDEGSLVGGAGNDIFDIRGGSSVKIADYGNGKDVILVNDLKGLNFAYSDDGKDLIVNEGITIENGAGKEITFATINEEYTTKTKNDVTTITGVKNIQTSMVRTFTSDTTAAAATVVSGGNSDYLQVAGDIDAAIQVVKAGKKATTMNITGANVKTVEGSGKADQIYVVNGSMKELDDDNTYYEYLTTVKSGGGNDTVRADSKGIFVSDFAKAVTKSKTDLTYKAGDILDFTNTTAPTINEGKLSADFDGKNVIIGDVQLANMKDQSIWIDYLDGTDTKRELVTLKNAHELDVSGVKNQKGAEISAEGEGTDITVIDATAFTKNAVITGGKYVREIYAGRGVDTIYAGAGFNGESGYVGIDSGNGADLIVLDNSNSYTTITTTNYYLKDYTNDKLVLDEGVHIVSAGLVDGIAYDSTTKGSGAKAVTTVYSDVSLTLSNGNRVYLDKVANVGGAGFKIYVQNGTAKNAPVQYLEYGASDVTIVNADGNVIDLTGAGISDEEGFKLKVAVDSARSKALTLQGAANGAVIDVETDSNNNKGAATTFIGNKYGTVTFKGGVKADKYIGNGANDIVDFSRGGANTVEGGRATVTFGTAKANDVVILNPSTYVTLTNFGTGGSDKIIIDNFNQDFDASLQSAQFINTDGGESGVKLTFATAGTYSTQAHVFLKNYNGEEIAISQNYKKKNTDKKASNIAMQTLTFGIGTAVDYWDGTTYTTITAVTGGKAADYISAYGEIASVTGGAGNDTFAVNYTYTTVTITDFNKGNDVLNLTYTTTFKLNNYSSDYIYDGGTAVTLKAGGQGIILDGVAAAPKKGKQNAATKAIRFVGSTDDKSKNKAIDTVKNGLALSNNVTITGAAANKDIDLAAKGMNFTKEYNNSSNQVTNIVAGGGLESYKAGSKADKLTLATYTTAASGVLTYTYKAQAKNDTDVITLKRIDTKQLKVEAAANNLSYEVQAEAGSNTVTLAYKTGNKAAGSSGKLQIVDDAENGGNFTYTFTFATTAEAKDSTADSKKYNPVFNVKVSGVAGLNDVAVGTYTDTKQTFDSADAAKSATKDDVTSYGAAQNKSYDLQIKAAGYTGLNNVQVDTYNVKVTTTEEDNKVKSIDNVKIAKLGESTYTTVTATNGKYKIGAYDVAFDTSEIGKLSASYNYEVTANRSFNITYTTAASAKSVDLAAGENNTKTFTIAGKDYTATYTTAGVLESLKQGDNDITFKDGVFTIADSGVKEFTIGTDKVTWEAIVTTGNFEVPANTSKGSGKYTIAYGTDAYGNSNTQDPTEVTGKSGSTEVDEEKDFDLADNSTAGKVTAKISSKNNLVTTSDEQFTHTVTTDPVDAVGSNFVNKAFYETATLYNDFMVADVNDLENVTLKNFNETAIVADLTTDFTKNGNAFNLASSAFSNKKAKK